MPIYDYKCRSCSKISEVILLSPSQKVACSCGSNDLERLLPSDQHIQFVDHVETDKGNLWWTNRYSNKKRRMKRRVAGVSLEKERDAWYSSTSRKKK